MNFRSISLHNYGIYKGTHTIHFDTNMGGRNITLIGAMNGRGKTTILEAIFLALFGSRCLKTVQERSIGYSKFLSTHINKDADDTYISIVCFEGELSSNELTVKRSWKRAEAGKKTIDTLEVFRDGEKDDYLSDNWNYYVEGFLPLGIARFCFFDNEKISQIVDDDSFSQIKESIKSIIGVSTVETLIIDMKKMIKDRSKIIRPEENSELMAEQEENDSKLKAVEDEIAVKNRELQEVKARWESVQNQFDEAEAIFWSKGGNLGLSRQEIDERKKLLQENKRQKESEINAFVSQTATPLSLCYATLKNAYNNYKKSESDIAKQYSSQVMQEVYGKLVQRISETFPHDTFVKQVFAIIDAEFGYYRVEANGLKLSLISPSSLILLEQMLLRAGEKKEKARLLLDEKAHIESELKKIEEHLSADASEKGALELYEKIKELELAKNENQRIHTSMAQELINLKEQRESLDKKRYRILTKIVDYQSKNGEDIRVVGYAAKTVEVMEEFKLRLQKKKIARLENNIETCFRCLASKENIISSVKIDPETIDITLYDSSQRILHKNQLSAGEKQMFAVAIVWGLSISSGFQLPIVIDTPMARLDSDHRHNFVTKYLPMASPQVIVLSTDEEISGVYLNEIRPYVNAYYTLQYNEEEECSFICQGYFDEVS